MRFLGPLLLLAASCSGGSTSPERPPDVLVITIDTLRSDFVSAYGAPYAYTPNLDEVGAGGAVFDAHHSVSSQTSPSHASLFTGHFPRAHGLLKNGAQLSTTLPTLATELKDAGYATAAAIGARVVDSRFGFAHGFDHFDEEMGGGNRQQRRERVAGTVVDRALEIMELEPGPLYLWVHVYDPHAPFSAPVDLAPESREIEEAIANRVETSDLLTVRELSLALRLYRQEIAYTDRELGRLIEAWEQRPHAENGLTVITSDHGEGMGEHGYRGHGFYLYQEQLEVPLFIRMPGRIEAGTRIESLTSSLDVAATVAELLDLPAGRLGGKSLVPILDGQRLEPAPLIAERRKFNRADLEAREIRRMLSINKGRAGSARGEVIAARDGDWKYVWAEDAPHELYDLAEDPAEAQNLFKSRKEEAERFRALVDAWRDRTALVLEEALPSLENDPDVADMLEDLGY